MMYYFLEFIRSKFTAAPQPNSHHPFSAPIGPCIVRYEYQIQLLIFIQSSLLLPLTIYRVKWRWTILSSERICHALGKQSTGLRSSYRYIRLSAGEIRPLDFLEICRGCVREDQRLRTMLADWIEKSYCRVAYLEMIFYPWVVDVFDAVHNGTSSDCGD